MTQWAPSGGHKACGAGESEACLAFCAPIYAENGSMKEGSEACCYSLRRQSGGRDLQQAAQGKSRRAEKEHGTNVSPAQRTAAAAERFRRRLR